MDTALSALDTSAALVKEVSEVLQNVPYANAIAGIVLQIIKVKDVRARLFRIRLTDCWKSNLQELSSNKAHCRELIESVARRSEGLFRDLKKIAQSNVRAHLNDMESDLQS